MAYQVIARKYRPQRFEDVVGQEHVTRTLSHAIERNRIAHAYLFCGPRGTGKTTLARIFAKCLNSTDGPKVAFAEDDERCIEIAEGRSLDVLEIDGASNRGIEEIRELRETVRYAPATSSFKIYIIDEVHMLTKEAFNALLKTLEEPPEHAKFMFATTEPEKVLPTILSRCQRFDLRRIPSALIVKHLAHIAGLEQVEVEEAALQAIARGADGGMRDAESTFDQLISFCGQSIVESDVLSMFGMASRDQILQLVEAMIAGDSLKVLQLVELLTSEGKELGRLVSDLLSFFRNLVLLQLSQENTDLLQVSETELAVLRGLSGKVSADRLSRLLDVLTDCDYRLKGASAKRIFFEVSLMKAMETLQSLPLNEVLKTLKDLRGEGGDGSSATPRAKPAPVAPPPNPPASRVDRPSTVPSSPPPPAPPAPAPPAPTPPPPVDSAPPPVSEARSGETLDLGEVWKKTLEHVAKKSPFTFSYLRVTKPLKQEGRELVIGVPPQARDNIALLESGKNLAMLNEALESNGFGESRIRFVEEEALSQHFQEVQAAEPVSLAKPEAPAASPAGADSDTPKVVEPDQVDLAEFRNDPLIKEALEIFKGQIVQTGKGA